MDRERSEPTEADMAAAREFLAPRDAIPFMLDYPSEEDACALAAFRAAAREEGYAAAREKGKEWMDRAIIAENEVARLRDEGMAENHAILTMTGTPREGYSLQQEIRARLEEANAELDELREENAALRRETRHE